MMLIPGAHIETLQIPLAYSAAQLDLVCNVATLLNRGPLILCEPPAKCLRCFDQPETYCVKCGNCGAVE